MWNILLIFLLPVAIYKVRNIIRHIKSQNRGIKQDWVVDFSNCGKINKKEL